MKTLYVTDPQGVTHHVTNIAKFAREHALNYMAFYQMAVKRFGKHLHSSGGWRLGKDLGIYTSPKKEIAYYQNNPEMMLHWQGDEDEEPIEQWILDQVPTLVTEGATAESLSDAFDINLNTARKYLELYASI